jgi:hypothetical protein
MDRNKIKERLELALRPAEPPTLEEVLEEVSTRGVLRGPVDWVFPAWMLYVEYATQRIIETFPLSEEEKRQLLDFRDALTRLLLEAWMQAKEKLAALYKAVAEGTYRVEGKRLYAPDGTWMHVRGGFAPYIIIHGVSAPAHFPDVLKLPCERLELLQLGWRASDEADHHGKSRMGTTQPWQVFAWATVRHGEFHIDIVSANLTREGVSVEIRIISRSWRQKWNKDEAIDLVVNHLRRGEWTPLLTMWLGDGESNRRNILRGDYKLVVVAKEPWKLGKSISTTKALVATGKEAFVRLRDAAGIYGVLLDLLKAYKWINIKFATDDVLRATYKQKTKKRSIDRLREVYRHNSSVTLMEQLLRAEEPKRGTVVVAGVVMYLELMNGKSGSIVAKYFTTDLGKAFAVAEKLESAGFRPNIAKSNSEYVVYIPMSDLLKLAEQNDEIRRAIAQYLVEKAENGTPRQKDIAQKILRRHPFFLSAAS